jgi:hypothetical protein
LQPYTGSLQTCTGSLQPYTGSLQTCTGSLQPNTGSLRTCTGSLQPNTGSLRTCTGFLQPYTGSLRTCTGFLQPYTGSLQPYTGSLRICRGSLRTCIGSLRTCKGYLLIVSIFNAFEKSALQIKIIRIFIILKQEISIFDEGIDNHFSMIMILTKNKVVTNIKKSTGINKLCSIVDKYENEKDSHFTIFFYFCTIVCSG